MMSSLNHLRNAVIIIRGAEILKLRAGCYTWGGLLGSRKAGLIRRPRQCRLAKRPLIAREVHDQVPVLGEKLVVIDVQSFELFPP